MENSIMGNVKVLKANERVSLLDVIEIETDSSVVLKCGGRIGLPHKVIQVNEACVFENARGEKTYVNAGDCVAAYRVAATDRVSGAFHVVRLTDNELMRINDILVRRFNSSLDKEKAVNTLPCVTDLPCMGISSVAVKGLRLKGRDIYVSDGRSSTNLRAIFQLTEPVSVWVNGTNGTNERHLYRARQGDVFVLLMGVGERSARLVPVSKEDVPAIKMQEKKEKLLRSWREEKTTTQKVMRIIRRKKPKKISKTEKIRN